MNSPAAPRSLAMLLAALAALGPFSIDTYLPSFPEIGQRLGASPLEVQQTLTAYLVAFSLMTLWHGALSDRFGRRRIILIGVAVFSIASLGCALVSNIQQLWLMRALQGISAGAGMVVGRALVRDIYQGAEAQRLMSRIAVMFALAPAVAPIAGGWLHLAFGWRAVFIFLALISAILWLWCWQALPETLAPEKRQTLNPRALLGAYRNVLSTPRFLAACGAIALVFSGFFVYVLSAPVFLIRHLGLAEDQFYWLFVPAMSGMMAGSWFSGRIAGNWHPAQTLRCGFAIAGFAALLNLGLSHWGPHTLPWPVVPHLIYTFGMALAMPTLTLLALDGFPLRRGLAASCQSFLQTATNALVAGVIAPMLWISLGQLALGMALFVGVGAAISFSLGDARYREN